MTPARSSFAAAACAAALAAMPVTAGATGSPGGGPQAAACNTVSYDGRAFVLYRKNVGCLFAKRWERRLHASRGENKPPGWRCRSRSRYRTGGRCTNGSRVFGWHPGD